MNLVTLKSEGWIDRHEVKSMLNDGLIQKRVKFFGNVIKGVVYRKSERRSDDRVIICDIQIVDPDSKCSWEDRKTICRLESVGFMCDDVKNQIGQLGAYVKLFKKETIEHMIVAANNEALILLDKLNSACATNQTIEVEK